MASVAIKKPNLFNKPRFKTVQNTVGLEAVLGRVKKYLIEELDIKINSNIEDIDIDAFLDEDTDKIVSDVTSLFVMARSYLANPFMSLELQAKLYGSYVNIRDLLSGISYEDIGIGWPVDRYVEELNEKKEFVKNNFKYKGYHNLADNSILSIGSICVYPEDMLLMTRIFNTGYKGTAIMYYNTIDGVVLEYAGKDKMELPLQFVKEIITPAL